MRPLPAKNERPAQKRNRVAITVSGGVVQQIMSDEPVEIHVFDFDDIKQGGDFDYPSIQMADQLTDEAYAELVQDVEDELKKS